MGGVNHLPTKHVSLSLTVPAAGALSNAISNLKLGNFEIEQLIQHGGKTDFGVEARHLQNAANRFDMTFNDLGMVQCNIKRILFLVGGDEYDPFDIRNIDVDTFVENCIADGLLTDCKMTYAAKDAIKNHGYAAVFCKIADLIDIAMHMAGVLRDTTTELVDGPEGRQGYFWSNVEANLNTWRQDYMRALTAITNLLSFWAGTAAICTEVHLHGTKAPSLLVCADTEVAQITG